MIASRTRTAALPPAGSIVECCPSAVHAKEARA